MKNKGIQLFLLLSGLTANAATWYIATTGSDSTGDGSIGNPYLTISNAVQSHLSKTVQNDFIIRGGNYYNVQVYVDGSTSSKLSFSSYPGESAVLYGGIVLTNWGTNGDGTYTASLPAFPGTWGSVGTLTKWQPRALLADGVPVKWAEYPDTSYPPPITNKLYFANSPNADFSSITYTNTMENTTNNEFCFDNSWNDAQVAAASINTGTKVITLSDSIYHISGGQAAQDVATYTLRNGKEGMINPNTFWWDKTNSTIVFKPPTGKQPNAMTVIVPTVDTIMRLHGGSMNPAGWILTNVCVSNLTFACTTAALAGGGKDDAASGYRGAIHMDYTTNSSIVNCTFFGLGGTAICADGSGQNVWNTTIKDCAVHDCGGAGISLNGSGAGNVVTNNLIYNIGQICQSGVGIHASWGATSILGNTVTNCNGSGIYFAASLGSTIAHNWIERAVCRLRDMGGIYGFNSTNNTIYHNAVVNLNYTNVLNGGDGRVIGIYLDNYTASSMVASNITFNCLSPAMHYRCGTSNTFQNNFFLCPTNLVNLWMGPGTPCDAGFRIAMYKNIIDASGTLLWNGSGADGSANDWTGNIFQTQGGTNAPSAATKGDPKFYLVPTATPQYLTDINLSFQAGSPAPGLGIQPLSIAGIGYNGGLKDLTPPPPGAVSIKAVNANIGSARSAP